MLSAQPTRRDQISRILRDTPLNTTSVTLVHNPPGPAHVVTESTVESRKAKGRLPPSRVPHGHATVVYGAETAFADCAPRTVKEN